MFFSFPAVYLLTSYGWFIVLSVIVLALVWTSIKPVILRWLRKREERWEEANFDPVKAECYQDSMMKAREKMQKELDEKAEEYQVVTEEVRDLVSIAWYQPFTEYGGTWFVHCRIQRYIGVYFWCTKSFLEGLSFIRDSNCKQNDPLPIRKICEF